MAMISFKEAYDKVRTHTLELGTERVPLLESTGRILAEPIVADRDFPPFNRATKDGIALRYSAIADGNTTFRIEGVASAGMVQQELLNSDACLEVMTGAVVPKNTNTVVMYEHLTIKDGFVTLNKEVRDGQNIHYKGSDAKKGIVLLKAERKISPAEIGLMASVGQSQVLVNRLPKVCAIATGNELVDIETIPESHQIRKSNSITLQAALAQLGMAASSLHLLDDKPSIEAGLTKALRENDVLLLSGGVSKGKFDFIPDVMDALGVEKVFHRVAQRPGKPFWFGVHKELKTVIFSFPGNPVSTFANYYLYFLPWLYASWGIAHPKHFVRLQSALQITPPLTRFIQATTYWEKGVLYAVPVIENGSGDLTSLAKADGFICLEPRDAVYEVEELVPFVPTR